MGRNKPEMCITQEKENSFRVNFIDSSGTQHIFYVTSAMEGVRMCDEIEEELKNKK